MTRTMTQQQFDAYLEATGYGISSDNGNVAYVSNKEGDVVAMYWRGKQSYLETLDESLNENDVLNPLDWNLPQIKDAIVSLFITAFVFSMTYFFIYVFA